MSVKRIIYDLQKPDNRKSYMKSNDKKSNFTTYFSILTEGGKNKKTHIKWIEEAKIMFNYKKQLLCLSNLSLEMKK
jgi:hypothetical protein